MFSGACGDAIARPRAAELTLTIAWSGAGLNERWSFAFGTLTSRTPAGVRLVKNR